MREICVTTARAANHPEQAEAFFDAVDFYRPVGQLIAEKYYGCRGCFIQLEGFPARCDDDCNGRLTLGRMVYMTGWFASRYWEYYTMTLAGSPEYGVVRNGSWSHDFGTANGVRVTNLADGTAASR